MRAGKIINDGLIAGTVAGLILGLFLKWVEARDGSLVYTLLLNIDFIPLIGTVKWPEEIEFLFHIVISWGLGIAVSFLAHHYKSHRSCSLLILSAAFTFPAVLLYFPLTLLSEKRTPPVTDSNAFLWWSAGHFLYAVGLAGTEAILLKRTDK
ncbi:hypothetical protein [Pseudalkalibacillus caeni]|uniref:DUF1440 domain-containing protein n=1 Tax=Exobacillus caeni TaxID=2574798 RepID=A0A5R9F7R8_9BACL|nr:hypothetical protein [Pseudalkalibacillus caeni]TLS37678.1 hypothetical protein FCL54_07585 [Pseudalkalibacillus caeni]